NKRKLHRNVIEHYHAANRALGVTRCEKSAIRSELMRCVKKASQRCSGNVLCGGRHIRWVSVYVPCLDNALGNGLDLRSSPGFTIKIIQRVLRQLVIGYPIAIRTIYWLEPASGA